MSSLKYPRATFGETHWPVVESARHLAVLLLSSASAMLAELSSRLTGPAAETPKSDPRLEFYAEAGAPEGALYLDGCLVALIHGVKRL